MSSNLLKSGWITITGTEKRMVDTNSLVSRKLDLLKAAMVSSDSNFVEGFTEGLEAVQVAELLGEDLLKPVYQGPSPDELIAKAMEEIDEMKKSAQAEIEQMKKAAKEEARAIGEKEGYQIGYDKGIKQTQILEKELIDCKKRTDLEYEHKLDEMEPKMVEALSEIYEHVFKVELGQYRSILLHLLTSTLRKVEGNRDFIIHVSKEDYPYVTMHKKQIAEAAGSNNFTMEIIEDMTLNKNDCMIETVGGIFDCSLGTQLDELGKKMRLLSYEKKNI